jgi:hypothetical protein
VEEWGALAAGVAESQPSVPVTVLTGEALDLSRFIDKHWEPVTGEGLIQEGTAEELRELVVAVSHAHAQFHAMTAATLEAPVDRGAFLLT